MQVLNSTSCHSAGSVQLPMKRNRMAFDSRVTGALPVLTGIDAAT